ncbi:MAG TPA: cupin domain-containing protein [Chitinophagaceae bacterium]|nr:cupin domain-containing protein [Chitinophagaceae bacterium]
MRLTLLISVVAITSSLKAQKTDSLSSHVYRCDNLEAKKEDVWIRRQVMEGSTTMLSNFEVHTTTLEPGKAPHPPHTHADQEELLIVKEGTVKISIKGESKLLGAGSIAFAMPGDEHGIENAGKTSTTYYVLKYKGKISNPGRAKQAGGSFMLDWNNLKTTNAGKGYRRDFFNRATSQLEQFEMHTGALHADSSSHAPHTHVQEEIILVLRGNVTMHISEKFYPASPGDVVFIPSYIQHALINTGNEQCEYFALQWKN